MEILIHQELMSSFFGMQNNDIHPPQGYAHPNPQDIILQGKISLQM